MDKEKMAAAQLLAHEILTGNVLFSDIENFLKPWVQDGDMGAALEKSPKNPDTNDFDAGVSVAATMLREGERLPDWLAVFAADVLQGKRTRPTKSGPDPYLNWLRDYKLARAVIEVSNRFRLPQYTKNELSNKITAAQIVSETAHLSLDVVHKAIQKFGGQISRVTSPQDTME